MIKIYSILSLILLWSSCCWAQYEDHIWMYGFSPYDALQEWTHQDTTWGATNIDFNFSPPKIYYDHDRLIDFLATNSSISNRTGEILIYTNGQAIWNGENEFIEDTINYNQHWENFVLHQDGIDVLNGFLAIQGAMMLPLPEQDSVYMLIYSQFNSAMSRTMNLFSAKIDLNMPLGSQVINKDQFLIENDTIASGTLNAVKHANGRDWWVMKLDRNNGNIFRFLLSPEGISDYDLLDFGDDFETSIGQLYFSPNGEYIAANCTPSFFVDGSQIIVANFDRSTGDIFDIEEEIIPTDTYARGLSFSPNSDFLYVSDGLTMYQYDLGEEDILGSRLAIEEYDGFNYYYTQDSLFPEPQHFGWMGLAPDGKIYVSTQMGSSRVMHRINKPNVKGVGCDMEQHSVYLPTSYARTIPNFPNYRLGPLDGSMADTLGIDNHPIAKFRYVQDTLDDFKIEFLDLSYFRPEEYSWDFGDGESSSDKNPTHTFAGNGVYDVCLTVSNENSSNTSCRTIMMGTTAVGDELLQADISLFPNPVRDDMILSFHDYIPREAELILYDVQGQKTVTYSLRSGMNMLNLSELISGIYVYQIVDGGHMLKSGKISKVQ